MVESAACMPQNLRLELIQSLFLVNDGKSAAFVPQNSNGATDGRRTTDRPSYPNLLRSQMGYILVCLRILLIHEEIKYSFHSSIQDVGWRYSSFHSQCNVGIFPG